MDKDYLVLKRASMSRSSGEWNDDDFDVLVDGDVVGRIFKVHAAPVGTPWMWTLAFGHHEDRWPTHGYEASCEAAMAAFAKSWRRQWPQWEREGPGGYPEQIFGRIQQVRQPRPQLSKGSAYFD
jgi:hypothetical protein